jgi:flagellar biosynthesis regulator FlaF
MIRIERDAAADRSDLVMNLMAVIFSLALWLGKTITTNEGFIRAKRPSSRFFADFSSFDRFR